MYSKDIGNYRFDCEDGHFITVYEYFFGKHYIVAVIGHRDNESDNQLLRRFFRIHGERN